METQAKSWMGNSFFFFFYLLITAVFVSLGPLSFSSNQIISSDFYACIEISSFFIAFIAAAFALAFCLVLKRFLKYGDIFSGMLGVCVLLNVLGQVYMSFSKESIDMLFVTVAAPMMPKNAIKIAGADHILSLANNGKFLGRLP